MLRRIGFLTGLILTIGVSTSLWAQSASLGYNIRESATPVSAYNLTGDSGAKFTESDTNYELGSTQTVIKAEFSQSMRLDLMPVPGSTATVKVHMNNLYQLPALVNASFGAGDLSYFSSSPTSFNIVPLVNLPLNQAWVMSFDLQVVNLSGTKKDVKFIFFYKASSAIKIDSPAVVDSNVVAKVSSPNIMNDSYSILASSSVKAGSTSLTSNQTYSYSDSQYDFYNLSVSKSGDNSWQSYTWAAVDRWGKSWGIVIDRAKNLEVKKHLATGFGHSIYLDNGGHVWAWGWNSYGQLGDGTTVDQATPKKVPGLSNIVAVAAGSGHSLALQSDGTVWTWGHNNYGELGTGNLSYSDNPNPTKIAGLSGVVSIAAGMFQTYAVKDDGTVWGCGGNYYGELGLPYAGPYGTLTKIAGLTKIRSVASGYYHSMALSEDGSIWSWGQNYDGELGNGTVISQTYPARVEGLSDIVEINCSAYDSFALSGDGTVWAWGENGAGKLGTGVADSNLLWPTRVLGLPSITTMTAGHGYSIAIDTKGGVWAWGYNWLGQLGNGSNTGNNGDFQTVPLLIEIQKPVVAAVADGHTLAMLADGTVCTWGVNTYGELGDGTTTARPVPAVAPAFSQFRQVVGGLNFSVALANDGTVWTWGLNNFGQIGDNTHNSRTLPTRVAGLSGVKKIAAGQYHTVALAADGKIWEWGWNAFGQIGDGTTADRSQPVLITSLSDVVEIAAGGYSTFAITADGKLWAWGYNQFGQLGDGTTTQRAVPTRINAINNITKIAPGVYHTAALTSDGRVWTWGQNGSGALGDGTSSDKLLPAPLSTILDVGDISAGYYYTVALKKNGDVWTWGDNAYGKLGIGNSVLAYSQVPVKTVNLSKVLAVYTNFNFTVALDENGNAWSWGQNHLHQIGDGTTGNHPSPYLIPGVQNISKVGTGVAHTLAISKDHEFWSWGSNSSGELGNGTTSSPATPVRLSFPISEVVQNSLSISFANLNEVVTNKNVVLFAGGSQAINDSTWNVQLVAVNGTNTTATTLARGASDATGTFTINIPADGLYYVVASVFDTNGSTANYQSPLFLVDTSGPKINLTANTGSTIGTTTYSQAGVTLTASVDTSAIGADPDGYVPTTLAYSPDGRSTWVYSDTVSFSAPGTYSVIFKVEDTLGNIGEASRTVIIDNTSPQLTSFPEGPIPKPVYAKPGYVLAFAGTDLESGIAAAAASWQVSSSGPTVNSLYNPATNRWEITFNSSGAYNITVTVTDRAGNATTQIWDTIVIDSAPPLVTTHGTPPSYRSPGGTYPLDISDSLSGLVLSSVQASLVQGGVVVASGLAQSFSPTGATDGVPSLADTVSLPSDVSGQALIRLSATDRSGNTTSFDSASFIIDGTSPTFQATSVWSAASGSYRSAGLVTTVTGIDLESGMDNQTGAGPTAGWSYQVRDSGGNPVSAASSAALSNGAYQVSVTTEGTFVLVITAHDLAGNSATLTTDPFTIDATAPSVFTQKILNPDGSGASVFSPVIQYSSGQAYTTFSVGDTSGVATVKASRSEGGQLPLVDLGNGRYQANLPSAVPTTLVIEATDKLGNSITVVAPSPLMPNNGPPTISATQSNWFAGTVWYRNSAIFYDDLMGAVSVVDPAGGSPVVWFTIATTASGTAVANLNSSSQVYNPAADGLCYVTVHATGLSGAEGTAGPYQVVFDRVVPFVTPVPSAWQNGSPLYRNTGLSYAEAAALFTASDSGGIASTKFTISQGQTIIGTLNTSGQSWQPILDSSADGTYEVGVVATDRAGNVTTLGPFSYQLDTIKPVSDPVTIYDQSTAIAGETPLMDKGFLTGTGFRVTLTGADANPGLVWQYQTRSSPVSGTLDWTTASPLTPSGTLLATSLGSSVVWIYTRLIDAAGNASEPVVRLVQADVAVPGSPTIISTTHPRASGVSGAVATTTAMFKLAPGSTGSAGSAGFRWALYEGTDLNQAKAKANAGGFKLSGTLSDQTLILPNLADNESFKAEDPAPGIYYLAVQVLGGNGKLSPESIYQFAIDFTPPSLLTVRSESHPVPTVPYASKIARFVWNQPVDFSGVRTFGYKALVYPPTNRPTTAIDQAVTSAAATGGSVNGFTPTTDRFLELDLSSAALDTARLLASGGTGFAQATLVVYAEDYAGNRQISTVDLQIDSGVPALVDPASFTLTSNASSQTLSVTWGSIVDNGAGSNAPTVRLRLLHLTPGNHLTEVAFPFLAQGGDGNHTFTGVASTDASTVFAVELTVNDEAGNAQSYRRLIDISQTGRDLSALISKASFREALGDYWVAGEETAVGGVYDPSQSTAALEAANTAFNSSGQIDLSYSRDQTGRLVNAANPTTTGGPASWTWTNDKRSLSGSGLVLDPAGLTLNNVRLTIPATVENSGNPAPPVNFDAVRIGLLPNQLWSAPAVSLDILTLSATSNADAHWQVNNLSAIGLAGLGWFAPTGHWTTNGLVFDAYVPEALGGSSGSDRGLQLSGPSFEGGRFVKAEVAEPVFHLAINGAQFTVSQTTVSNQAIPGATLLADRLLINHANLLYGGLPVAELADFAVLPNGQLVRNDHFRAVALGTITLSTGTLTIGAIDIVDGQLTLTDATLTTAENRSIRLTNARLDSEQGLVAGQIQDQLSAYVQGFLVNASGGELQPSNIVRFAAATVALSPFTANATPIADMRVRLADLGKSSITLPSASEATGWIGANGPSGAFDLSTAYGTVRASNLVLDNTGIHTDLAVAMPAAWVGSGDTPLMAAGRFTLSNLPDSTGASLNREASGGVGQYHPRGYPVTVDGLSFVSNGLSIEHLVTTLPQTTGASEFIGLTMRADGSIVAEGQARNFALTSGSWQLIFATLNWGPSGPHGRPAVDLPASLGNERQLMGETTVAPDGTYTMASLTDQVLITVHGWSVAASGLHLVNDILVFDAAALDLPGIMATDTVNIGAIGVDSGGSVVVVDGPTGGRFRATNGFLVETEAVRFAPEGLYAKGRVFLPEALGGAAVNFGTDAIFIDSDGAVIAGDLSTSSNLNQTVVLAGWGVKLAKVRFDRTGLTIQDATVRPFSLVEITLPTFSLYADGTFSVNGQSFEPFGLAIADGLSVGVRSVRFTANGLTLSAFITLPPEWGVSDLYFDSLTLHPDGTITSDLRIPSVHLDIDFLGLALDLSNVSFAAEGFGVESAVFTLTKGEWTGRSFTVRGLTIKPNGSIAAAEIDGAAIDIWGYQAELTSFALDMGSRSFSFSGGIRLASNFPVAELAGRYLALKACTVGFDGSILAFDLAVSGQFRFPIFDSWYVNVTDVEIDRQTLKIRQGSLELPPGLGIASVDVHDISLNLATGEFGIGSITIPEAVFDLDGVKFVLSTLSIDKTRGLLFGGRVTVPALSTSGVAFPDIIAGKTLVVNSFQIRPDLTIGDIDAELQGLNGPIISNDLILKNGKLRFASTGGAVRFSLGGSVILGAGFPTGLAGSELDIAQFTINFSDASIEALDIAWKVADSADPVRIDTFFGVGTLLLRSVGVAKTASGAEISVAGALELGSAFPPAFRGRQVAIRNFQIDTSGQVLALDAGFSLPDGSELFEGVTLDSASLAAQIVTDQAGRHLVFAVNGSVRLGPQFPEGLAGLSVSIASLKWQGDGTLLDMKINLNLPADLTLFQGLHLKNGAIGFSQAAGESFPTIGLAGSLVLPTSLPDGLAGLSLNIKRFDFRTNGTILAIDAGFSINSLNLFGVVKLNNFSLAVQTASGERDRLIFTIGGALQLPDTLPGALSGLTVVVSKFQFDSRGTLLALEGGLTGEAWFDLFGGFRAGVTKLVFNSSGISFGGKIQIPDGLLEGLPHEIGLDDLTINYQGQVTNLRAVIGAINVKIAGFGMSVTNLVIGTGGVSMAKATITLPDNLGGRKIDLTNPGFDRNGNFTGSIGIDSFSQTFAGFTLSFKDPSFDFSQKIIRMSQVAIRLPEFVGNTEMAVNGVTISPAGVQLGGLKIQLPTFTMGDGLGFRNCYVDFTINGNTFDVQGNAEAIIPGVGVVSAFIAFTNVSDVYPIGLKRAFFSWEIAGIGLPIGATGLYLNGIRGGIAFGPPEEVPAFARGYFPNRGIRLQLGVTLSAGEPRVANGKVDVWIDVQNWSWAFRGQITVLSGFASGRLDAAMGNGKGFYGGFFFEIRFARGSVEVWIFDHNGRTLVNASGQVQIGLPKGSLFHARVDIDFLFVHIHEDIDFPDSDVWGPTVGAEFGTFRNGAEGVKAWFDFLFFHNIGFFAGPGRFSLGNVSEYELLKP